MLVESQIFKSRYEQTEVFEFYNELVDSFVSYLKNNENLNISVDTDEETIIAKNNFLKMPLEVQRLKLLNFQNYYDHCVKIVSDGESLRKKDISLKGFTFLYGLSIPSEDEIFELLEKDVFVEIYDKNFLQIYRSPNWLETTSYGLKTLETQDWRNLFYRSEEILGKQMQVIKALYSGQVKQPIHKPIQVHTVKELKERAPYCCELESLLYSPVYDKYGEFTGGLHLLKLHDLRRLDFQVYSEPIL